MPGRDDFAIVRSSLLTDERTHRAAEEYVKRKWATPDTAVPLVVGHVALIGLWTSRETDNGVLPGTGTIPVMAALMTSRTHATAVIEILRSVGLLRDVEGGVYACGWSDCYAPIIERRERDRVRKAKDRSSGHPADVQGMSSGCPGAPTGPTGPDRPNPPVPTDSGGSRTPSSEGRNGHDPTLKTIKGALAMAEVIRNGKDVSGDRRAAAKAITEAIKAGTASTSQIEEFVNKNFHDTAARIAYLK